MKSAVPVPHLRLRKHLGPDIAPPVWAAGIAPVAIAEIDPRAAHAVLAASLPVADFNNWHATLLSDSEYDPELCVAAVTGAGAVVGVVQCWTSAFVKDLAVAPDWRRHSIGTSLMQHAFTLFSRRGAAHVDLKVDIENHAGRQFYARLGMMEISSR
ncbi:Ribosomal protein S18 acetylase RimI [Devosia lucknowensis]|uniref:Ribosomal protein S18 acetylase RimI n=1 Tax=Devosia lucknowensis TaxID=1096929 RepID=A0A1Y6F947_9HYPH|nr:N-acetyltransferase [Devosia lucknowensis]SMQ70121.1 Ribosomal protein S18 acetylase RimI [Devosia lucknowensis]